MSNNVLYAIKKDDLYLSNRDWQKTYSTLDKAWLLSETTAKEWAKHYSGEIVKVKLVEEKENNDNSN